MASKGHIGAKRDTAVAALIESGQAIADLLGIDAPQLNFFYRDREYQQAEELKTLAAFNQRVYEALLNHVTQSEKEVSRAPQKRAKQGMKA